MADQTLSAREAAERLGVSYSTLKGWLDRIPLGLRRNDRGEYSIDQAALDLLASVRDWRADGSGINTITKRIRPFNTEPATEGGPAAGEPSPDHGRATDESVAQTAGVVPVAELLPVIQEVSRLTMALSEASYRQGQLEEQVRQLTAQADQAAASLTDGQAALQQVQERAARAEGEAQALRQQLVTMQAQAARPWWHRLIGR